MTASPANLAVHSPPNRSSSSPGRRRTRASASPSRSSIAYTLTACTRCRERKSRCDPALPKCTPCERSGAHCEYWDATKRRRLPRNYIVQLQNQVRSLEQDLAKFNVNAELEPDQEDMVREAALVEFRDTAERKFLGPSSGTPMTRLVMRFAKQVAGAATIRHVITSDKFRIAEDQNAHEQGKATSKIDPESYPLVSSYAAAELPGRDLCLALLRLYNVKVQTMYPLFHETRLQAIFEETYAGSTDPFNNFITRIIIAIGLQRLDTKYAGAGDSYYLGALAYFEQVVRAMNLQTLQCFVLIGQYCLLTPTRTAAFYIVGIGVRIAQSLGITDETTLRFNKDGSAANPYDIDMKRRIFWAIVTMDYGLSHSLGRPAMLATHQDHLNVEWFAAVEDKYITPQQIVPGPFSIRKWIAIHFYKMRLLQLEIRRMLYLHKRPTPADENDPWFKQMETKLEEWRDASPNDDQGSGFSRTWFTGRYNTMVIFLFRPSPQVPTPSSRSARLCYQACEYNIHMTRQQIAERSVELTWIFTQTIFSCVNTILWALSYAEIRQMRSREEVKKHLMVAVEAMQLASERWPGVTSAIYIYEGLIGACLHAYEKEGDISINSSPFTASDEMSDSSPPSRTQSPSLPTQSPSMSHMNLELPHSSTPQREGQRRPHAGSGSNLGSTGYLSEQSSPLVHYSQPNHAGPLLSAPATNGNGPQPAFATHSLQAQYNPLPTTYAEMNNWHFQPPLTSPLPGPSLLDIQNSASTWLDPEDDQSWAQLHEQDQGLTQSQQSHLMNNLQNNQEMRNIERMISASNDFLASVNS